MKKIEFRSFSDCFKIHPYPVLKGFAHPQWICAFIFILAFIFGFKFRFALVLALTLAFILAVNYFYLRSVAENLLLKTEPVKATSESEIARLNLSLSNLSSFSISNLLLIFDFAGSASSTYVRLLETEISASSLHRSGADLLCDNGMGVFEVKNFCLAISDIFDIFQFKVFFDQKTEVEVRPKIEEVPKVSTRGSKYSEFYGNNEIQSRGISVNFSNLRPYSFGDSVRHIAWRPSVRHSTLIVKEFERMVNTDATFILNLNPTQHVGLANLNTWETAKDICLSLVSQMLATGNSVEFVYNYGTVSKSTGKEQFYAISKALVEHDIISAAEGEHKKRIHIDDPLSAWANRIVPGSTLFYILAVNYPHLRDITQLLKWLSRESVEVILVLINPLTIWPEFKALDPSIETPDKTDKINILLTDLQIHGVRVFFADMGGPIADQFREKARLSEKLTAPRFAKRADVIKGGK